MKAGKAPGPSGIVVKMIWAAVDMGASMICDLAAAIIGDGKVPSDWEQSFIICLYKGRGGCIGKGQLPQSQSNRAGHESPGEDCGRLISQLVLIDNSQFDFVPGRGTTDAIFVVRQLQEKYLAANKRLHCFRRPGEGFWSSTSEDHLMGAKKTWCGGVDCTTSAGDVCKCAELCPCWWGVQWRVWSEGQCSLGLSTQPLLFIIVLEALSQEFRSGVPWEDLYADDLVIIAESLEECVRRLLTWKEAMEKKGLRVNAGKTKIMICGMGLDLRQSSGEFPCSVCCTGVGSNSIFCHGCKHWVHKKCSGLKRLTKDPDYRCTRCQGIAHPLDGRPQREVQVGLTSWWL